jgi:hypothetical protein
VLVYATCKWAGWMWEAGDETSLDFWPDLHV